MRCRPKQKIAQVRGPDVGAALVLQGYLKRVGCQRLCGYKRAVANSKSSAGPNTGIDARKKDHLRIAASGEAGFRNKTSLFEEVDFVHQSLSELALADVNLETEILGHRMSAPIFIAGMTGGTEEASAINQDLAKAAETYSLGFGVGSQRAMAEHPELAATFQVRDVAPNVFLVGNIGAVQAKEIGVKRVEKLIEDIGANALAIHLNPAQELVQENGDRDFTGLLKTIKELANGLSVPVLAKETGCGFSLETASALQSAGVAAVDVSGAGGTSWTAVEALRASKGSKSASLGEELWDWGIPTAASATVCARNGLEVIATGGIRSGRDIACALALGAKAGGLAAPFLKAQREGGYDKICEVIENLMESIRAIFLLTGSKDLAALQKAPKRLGPELLGWLHALGIR